MKPIFPEERLPRTHARAHVRTSPARTPSQHLSCRISFRIHDPRNARAPSPGRFTSISSWRTRFSPGPTHNNPPCVCARSGVSPLCTSPGYRPDNVPRHALAYFNTEDPTTRKPMTHSERGAPFLFVPPLRPPEDQRPRSSGRACRGGGGTFTSQTQRAPRGDGAAVF